MRGLRRCERTDQLAMRGQVCAQRQSVCLRHCGHGQATRSACRKCGVRALGHPPCQRGRTCVMAMSRDAGCTASLPCLQDSAGAATGIGNSGSPSPQLRPLRLCGPIAREFESAHRRERWRLTTGALRVREGRGRGWTAGWKE